LREELRLRVFGDIVMRMIFGNRGMKKYIIKNLLICTQQILFGLSNREE